MAKPTKIVDKIKPNSESTDIYDVVPTMMADGTSNYKAELPTLSKDETIIVNSRIKYYKTTSASNVFSVTIPYITSLEDGMIIHCQFDESSATGATLNVNNLGAKNIQYRYATAVTSHITKDNYVDLIYSSALDKWVMLFSYDSNSTDYLSYSATAVSSGTTKNYILGKQTVASNRNNYYNTNIYFENDGTLNAPELSEGGVVLSNKYQAKLPTYTSSNENYVLSVDSSGNLVWRAYYNEELAD